MVTLTTNEVYSDSDKFIRRLGTESYFKRSTVLKGDTVDDFVEVDRIPSPELEEAISKKLEEIKVYDSSSEVNQFFYSNLPLWLSREDRIVLKDRFTRERDTGISLTPLVFGDIVVNIPPLDGILIIDELCAYADKCFDNTERHKRGVKSLSEISEVEAYDYKSGYPDKLKFGVI